MLHTCHLNSKRSLLLLTLLAISTFLAVFLLMCFYNEPLITNLCQRPGILPTTYSSNRLPSPLLNQVHPIVSGKLRDAQWSVISGTDTATYSAFYDDRFLPPIIRVLGVTPLKRRHSPLYCHLSYNETFLTVGEALVEILPEHHDTEYSAAYIICCLHDKTVPSRVSISVSKTNSPMVHEQWLRIVTSRKDCEKRETFGLCLPILFTGDSPPSPLQLIEFFEMSKILGVNQIIVYVGTMSDVIKEVIGMYTKTGFLTIQDFNLRTDLVHRGLNTSHGNLWNVWYGGQLVCINDCLYRYMYRFKYIAFQDLDEFILPKLHSNWVKMMQHLESLNRNWWKPSVQNAAGFLFRNSFVYYDDKQSTNVSKSALQEMCKNISEQLRLLETDFTICGRYWKKHWRSKMIVLPEHIVTMGIHQTHKLLDWRHFEYDVPIDIGILHHLRRNTVTNIAYENGMIKLWPSWDPIETPVLQRSQPMHAFPWKSELEFASQHSFRKIFCSHLME